MRKHQNAIAILATDLKTSLVAQSLLARWLYKNS